MPTILGHSARGLNFEPSLSLKEVPQDRLSTISAFPLEVVDRGSFFGSTTESSLVLSSSVHTQRCFTDSGSCHGHVDSCHLRTSERFEFEIDGFDYS